MHIDHMWHVICPSLVDTNLSERDIPQTTIVLVPIVIEP